MHSVCVGVILLDEFNIIIINKEREREILISTEPN